MNSDEKWDRRFIDLCYHIAKWSKDPSTKVGCVIVDNKRRIVSVGYNGFPRGVDDLEERYNERETKLKFVAHAERNAFDNAVASMEGCTLYTTLLPCNECAKSVIQNGITRVVAPTPMVDGYNWDITKIMFKEAKILLDFI